MAAEAKRKTGTRKTRKTRTKAATTEPAATPPGWRPLYDLARAALLDAAIHYPTNAGEGLRLRRNALRIEEKKFKRRFAEVHEDMSESKDPCQWHLLERNVLQAARLIGHTAAFIAYTEKLNPSKTKKTFYITEQHFFEARQVVSGVCRVGKRADDDRFIVCP